MRQLVKPFSFRVLMRDLLDIKDAYNLFDTQSTIKLLFEQQYPSKELLLECGFKADPDSINDDVVVVQVWVRDR